jgi:hypothetical protein
VVIWSVVFCSLLPITLGLPHQERETLYKVENRNKLYTLVKENKKNDKEKIIYFLKFFLLTDFAVSNLLKPIS